MKNQFIEYLWNHNKDFILEKSLINCHVRGLHSIVLQEVNGKLLRLYVSEPFSDLSKNNPNNLLLSVHPHHCDLTLECVQGSFTNIIFDKSYTTSAIPLQEWKYESKITTGEPSFKRTENRYTFSRYSHQLGERDSVFMKANELHTVVTQKGIWSAWMVYEGTENPDYKNVCYTNMDTDPNYQLHTDLYQKPTEKEIYFLLSRIFKI